MINTKNSPIGSPKGICLYGILLIFQQHYTILYTAYVKFDVLVISRKSGKVYCSIERTDEILLLLITVT